MGNNAGVNAAVGPLEASSEEALRYTMETNYFGAARMLRLVVPDMRQNGRGAIINVTSAAAVFWPTMQAPYNASKSAMETLSTTLAQEVARFGLRVCTIRPGVIITPMLNKSGPPDMIASKPYLDQLGHYLKFFKVGAAMKQTPEMVGIKILEVLRDSGPWKAGYDVGMDAEAMGKVMRDRGADWLALEGGEAKSNAEQIEFYRSFGIDVSASYRKSKL